MPLLIRLLNSVFIAVCVLATTNVEWLLSEANSGIIDSADVGNYIFTISNQVVAVEDPPNTPASLVFVGDLLLARNVERLANQHGDHYSFSGFSEIFTSEDVIVANFESTIPSPHLPTPDFTFRFSTPYRLAALLPEYNIHYVSLANNHAYDFGPKSYVLTKSRLAEAGVTAFGHPSVVSSSSVAYIEIGTSTVAIVGMHTLFNTPTQTEITTVLTEAEVHSDWQIAYVHWGNEYEIEHNETQREFAKQLVAAGVDVIIGHHPHVVQDIDLIDGVPVFYSLGNFIFDQYFSTAVQEGLVLRVIPGSEKIDFELIPVTSEYNRAQPQRMTEAKSENFLRGLFSRSDIPARLHVRQTGIPTPKLASSTQMSIMTE